MRHSSLIQLYNAILTSSIAADVWNSLVTLNQNFSSVSLQYLSPEAEEFVDDFQNIPLDAEIHMALLQYGTTALKQTANKIKACNNVVKKSCNI
jgi:hypothetical protein